MRARTACEKNDLSILAATSAVIVRFYQFVAEMLHKVSKTGLFSKLN